MFEIGKQYTKRDIYNILDVSVSQQHGAWDTGYREYNGEIFIFANIGVPGRSGDNHANAWVGDVLHWEAKQKSNISQPLIEKILDPSINKHIFTRENNLNPFIYEGLGTVEEYFSTVPVKILWSFNKLNDIDQVCENEVEYNKIYKEGVVQQITINAYERNPDARRKCISHFGYKCAICDFDYYKFYGEYAKDYIQIHHIKPLAEIGKEYVLDPLTDLIPICANCHSIIHRRKHTLLPDELRRMIK